MDRRWPRYLVELRKFHYGSILGGGKVSALGLLKRCNEEDGLEAQVSMTCSGTSPHKTLRHLEKAGKQSRNCCPSSKKYVGQNDQHSKLLQLVMLLAGAGRSLEGVC